MCSPRRGTGAKLCPSIERTGWADRGRRRPLHEPPGRVCERCRLPPAEHVLVPNRLRRPRAPEQRRRRRLRASCEDEGSWRVLGRPRLDRALDDADGSRSEPLDRGEALVGEGLGPARSRPTAARTRGRSWRRSRRARPPVRKTPNGVRRIVLFPVRAAIPNRSSSSNGSEGDERRDGAEHRHVDELPVAAWRRACAGPTGSRSRRTVARPRSANGSPILTGGSGGLARQQHDPRECLDHGVVRSAVARQIPRRRSR